METLILMIKKLRETQKEFFRLRKQNIPQSNVVLIEMQKQEHFAHCFCLDLISQNNKNESEQIAVSVKNMIEAQRAWAKNKTASAQLQAMNLEREVDAIIKDFANKQIQSKNPTLF